MKKIITLIVILAVAITANAQMIKDPGFTNDDATFVTGNTILPTLSGRSGWTVHSTDWEYDTVNHLARRLNSGSSSPRGICQATTDTSGTWAAGMKLVVSYQGAANVGTLYIQTFGSDNGTWGGGLRVDSLNVPTDAVDLGSLTTNDLPDGASGNFVIDVADWSGYTYFATRIALQRTASVTPDLALEVTNVEIIPEPAALGLLALGILAFIRRK